MKKRQTNKENVRTLSISYQALTNILVEFGYLEVQKSDSGSKLQITLNFDNDVIQNGYCFLDYFRKEQYVQWSNALVDYVFKMAKIEGIQAGPKKAKAQVDKNDPFEQFVTTDNGLFDPNEYNKEKNLI